MPSNIPDDVAYTITTGYYPEIASSVKYRKRKGKGGTGKKYINKRGYNDTSITKGQTTNLSDFAKSVATGTEGAMAGKKLFKKMTGTKDDPLKTWYKFTGGSENYKLYGDQVWYMHGARKSNEVLTDYVKGYGDTHPAFGQIYSRMEGQLVGEAAKLAEEVFDIALSEVEKNLDAGEGGSDAAEEIGFKDGEFEYMSHDAAMKNPQLVKQLKKQALSAANPRDMVIIKNGQIVGTRDVTEMPIDKIGQHGIVSVPRELTKAIQDVKAGGGEDMQKLKQGVIKMFTNAISKNYNPVINQLKREAGFGGASGKDMKGDWGKVLKSLSSHSKNQKPGNTVSTIQMGNILNQQMIKVGLQDSSIKSSKQTSIEYVAHMLGTLNLNTNEVFKQSHLVHEMPDGQGVYATVPMVTDPKTLLFKQSAVDGTEIVTGYNATLAQAARGNWAALENATENSKTQKWSYTMSKTTGVTASSSGQGIATANMGICRTTRPATIVTIPASDKLEEALLKDIKDGMDFPSVKKGLGRGNNSKLQKKMYGLGNRRKKMKKNQDPNKTQFWALPYIGVLGSDYIEK